MSLYHEAAEILAASSAAGNLRSRVFSRSDLKSSPAQVFALAVETTKWSSVLKEIIEHSELLRLERKLSPILSLLLVHDLLLTKDGIALPPTHGLRAAVNRHKARMQSELTKARIRRKLASFDALKAHIECGLEEGLQPSQSLYPRWIRINTLKTTIEDQLHTTFADFEQVTSVDLVRQSGQKRLLIDGNVPNLIAVSPKIDVSKSEAYKSGLIIFQDKASCFPAYLLDPLATDGDIVDACSAPGNKTTHLAAILVGHHQSVDDCSQMIHAFEKSKIRAQALEKMVGLAQALTWTKLHPGHDFLKTDPSSPVYENVGALLLDPSCSGSGIVDREETSMLHLPNLQLEKFGSSKDPKINVKQDSIAKVSGKRKRAGVLGLVAIADDAESSLENDGQLKSRLAALSAFQFDLLLHAFQFPAARKIVYSTCSIHAEENEEIICRALASDMAQSRGWRILKRNEQIKGMREWPIRGKIDACDHDEVVAEACVRTNLGDSHGTMGFFVAGFVREQRKPTYVDLPLLRDDRGHLVRDLTGMPIRTGIAASMTPAGQKMQYEEEEEEEWNGFEDRIDGKKTLTILEASGGFSSKSSRKKQKRETAGVESR